MQVCGLQSESESISVLDWLMLLTVFALSSRQETVPAVWKQSEGNENQNKTERLEKRKEWISEGRYKLTERGLDVSLSTVLNSGLAAGV